MNTEIIARLARDIQAVAPGNHNSLYAYGSSLQGSAAGQDLDLLWVGKSDGFQGQRHYLHFFDEAFPPGTIVDAIYVCVDELVLASENPLHPYVVQALCLQTYAQHLWGEDVRASIPLLTEETILRLRSWDCFRYWRYFLHGGKLRALKGMLQGIAVATGEVPLSEARLRSSIHQNLLISEGSWGELYREVIALGDLAPKRRGLLVSFLLDFAENSDWADGQVLPLMWGKWSINGELAALFLSTEKDKWEQQGSIEISGFSERLKKMVLNDTRLPV